MDDHGAPPTRFEWERAVRDSNLPAPSKLIALTLGTHTGSKCRRPFVSIGTVVEETTIYIALMEGEDPETTRPILMTRDRELLRAFAEALDRRIREGASGGGRRRALELPDANEGRDG